jgi:hypothetical protein
VVALEMKDKIISTISEIEENIDGSENSELGILEDGMFELDDELIEDSSSKEIAFDGGNLINEIDDNEFALLHREEDVSTMINDSVNMSNTNPSEEIEFLEKMKSRLVVVFEGLQSPNNKKLEAKVDLILNFLEYNLAMISDKLDTLKHEKL